jgi:hypothetical protein
MWRPALGGQIDRHQQKTTEEITIMSQYGDFEYIKAETDYRIERARTAPWIDGGVKAVRRRVSLRRNTAESRRRSHDKAA